MKNKILSLIAFLALFSNLAFCEVISGKIHHDDINYQNKVVDSRTQQGLEGAKVSIPDINFTTYCDENGYFQLNADVNKKTVLFVEKDGYKVFSLTIDNNVISSPLKIGIEKMNPFDLQISDGLIHLGDNMFSQNSANCSQFRLSASGSYFVKEFKKPKCSSKQDVVLKIGSLIGLDTKKAKLIGQNRIAKVYSAPSEVLVNGHKIAKLELNGDNIEITIPKSVLKENNELLIQSGRNLFQTSYVDYDDIELANISVEIKDKTRYAKY